jgi:hypothetical protein
MVWNISGHSESRIVGSIDRGQPWTAGSRLRESWVGHRWAWTWQMFTAAGLGLGFNGTLTFGAIGHKPQAFPMHDEEPKRSDPCVVGALQCAVKSENLQKQDPETRRAWRRGVFQNAVGFRRWRDPSSALQKRGTREGGWFWASRATPLVRHVFFFLNTDKPVEMIQLEK